MKELEQLENQIEISLKHIRTRKVENLTSSICISIYTVWLAYNES